MENETNELISVLFLCHGNICRSPMAEGLFLHRINQNGWSDRFHVDSAGIINHHEGEQADRRMLRTAERHGIHVPSISRPITESDLELFNYVLAMDELNVENLELSFSSNLENVKIMRSFEPYHTDINVPDPWFGDAGGFEECYHLLDRCVNGFVSFLRKNHSTLN